MTVKPPAPPPLPDELERLLHRLRLPYVRRAAAEVIATATSQRWEHAEVLKVLLPRRPPAATKRRSGPDAARPGCRPQDVRRLGTRSVGHPSGDAARAADAGMDRSRGGVVRLRSKRDGQEPFVEALGPRHDKGRTVTWHTPETPATLRRHRVDDSVNKAIGKPSASSGGG